MDPPHPLISTWISVYSELMVPKKGKLSKLAGLKFTWAVKFTEI